MSDTAATVYMVATIVLFGLVAVSMIYWPYAYARDHGHRAPGGVLLLCVLGVVTFGLLWLVGVAWAIMGSPGDADSAQARAEYERWKRERGNH